MSLVAEEDQEQLHFCKVVKSFNEYNNQSAIILNSKIQALNQLPSHLKRKPQERLLSLLDCIESNQSFFRNVVSNHPFIQSSVEVGSVERKEFEKVKSTLRQFVRDWSVEGAEERELCYSPILRALSEIYDGVDPHTIRVLVPGAGLGRLAFDIVRQGFVCQGNEFSFYMLLGSNYILNQTIEINSISLYPWIHQFSNQISKEIQAQKILIPDICPASVLESNVDFSMVGGDFVEVYSDDSQRNQWDCIVTCFFIDTAKNFIEYLKVIKGALKRGGSWINLGPLLYHFEGDDNAIEFTSDEILDLINTFGFTITVKDQVTSGYASCTNNMMQYNYRSLFFTAILSSDQ